MLITVELQVEGEKRPRKGAPVIVQVRDTSLQDAPARILAEARGAVGEPKGGTVAVVTVDLERYARDATVWAHIDSDGDGRVSAGDFLTTRSYPLPAAGEPSVRITLRPV